MKEDWKDIIMKDENIELKPPFVEDISEKDNIIFNDLSEEDKIEFLRIALQLQKIGVDNKISERIIKTYEKILLLKGKFSIMDALEIDYEVNKKYKEIE